MLRLMAHLIQCVTSFSTLSCSAPRFVPRMFSKTAIIGLINTQSVGERRWERCLQNAKSMRRSRAPFGVCLPTRRPWPKSRTTTATFAATEHMARQNTAARNQSARGKSSSSRKEPRGAPSFFTFYVHSRCRKQKSRQPKRDHTVAEAPAAGNGRCPIRPEHEEGMQNAICTCSRKRPARRADTNWRIVSPPSRSNFADRPPI